jgi:hypothetical protein
MTRRRALAGLCMLCALALSAFAAQSASATTKGTTAFTCVKTGAGGTFTREHCAAADAGSGNYSHVAVAQNTTTEVIATNQKTNSETTASTPVKLKATIAGVTLELQATGWEGSGWIENKKDENGEHYVEDGGTVTFSGVIVTIPTGKGCKVWKDEEGVKGAEGVIKTNPLRVTSTEQGEDLKFEGVEGGLFATFFLECTTKVPACEGTISITGSLKASPNGATVAFDHNKITEQNTLKIKGSKAGLEGKVTIRGRDGKAGDTEYTPISITTVETP